MRILLLRQRRIAGVPSNGGIAGQQSRVTLQRARIGPESAAGREKTIEVMGTRRDDVASNEVCLEHLFCRLLREIADERPTWPDTVQQLVEYVEIRISKRDPFSGIIGRHTRLGL